MRQPRIEGERYVMADTKELLQRISSLRVRLDQAQGIVHDRTPEVVPMSRDDSEPVSPPLPDLQEKIRITNWNASLLDGALRPLTEEPQATSTPPARLTARGARLLKRGREMLNDLRGLLEEPVIKVDETEALTCLHAETAGMLDSLLRTVQVFPPSPSAQLRLCDGLEAVLLHIEERMSTLTSALAVRRVEHERVEFLADLFRKLGAGQSVAPQHFLGLAETIGREANLLAPVRFFHAAPDDPARFVAAHVLTVSRLMALLLHDDADWRHRLEEALFATLLYDVGMVRVPAHLLRQEDRLSDDQRRLVERHPNVGAHMLSRILPNGGLAVEAAIDHHERLDGTGYPAGRRESQLSPFVRLLAVCDTFAAMCARRPHRGPRDTRTAMTDTLLLADHGALDRFQSEKLLTLSFYPVGSLVELSDGSIGLVVAPQMGKSALLHPAQPIVSLLAGPGGSLLSAPSVIDLMHDSRTILRGLLETERRSWLWRKFPALA